MKNKPGAYVSEKLDLTEIFLKYQVLLIKLVHIIVIITKTHNKLEEQ